MASGFDTDVISLIDARRGYVYAGGYDKDLNVTYKDNKGKIKLEANYNG